MLNRAIDVGYPPGSTFKPVTALAAMQEGLLTPNTELQCTPTFKAYGQTFHNWTPLINQAMDLRRRSPSRATRTSTSSATLLPPAHESRPPAAGLGEPLRLRRAHRYRPRARDARADPDTRVAKDRVPGERGLRRARPDLEAGLLDPDRDRTGRRARDTAADGALLRADRERRQARHAARRRRRRADRVRWSGRSACCAASARSRPSRPASIRPRSSTSGTGSSEATHSPLGTSSGVFGNFPIDIVGKTGSAEKFVPIPGYKNPLKLTQSWWCGYGPFDAPSIVVCAVIENGGHGGDAAAPAALRVFEQYFHKTATTAPHASD